MSNNTNNTLLCDMGGTHARFARLVEHGKYSDFKKYRLNDFESFPDIIQKYIDESGLEFTSACFSLAQTPVEGVITYDDRPGYPNYSIDFNAIQAQFGWNSFQWLNDLEAGAHGATQLKDNQLETIIDPAMTIDPANNKKWNTHKILISVGTGVGHAGIMDGRIFRTCGGHFLPVTVTNEHRALENFVRDHKNSDRPLIMEDFISGRGLRSITEFTSGQSNADLSPTEFMAEIQNHPNAIRLFFELLGLHAHIIVNATGFYGGVYLTGGVIDNLIKNDLTNWTAFQTYFCPPKFSIYDHLSSVKISYVLDDELPLLGLTVIDDA